MTITSVKSSTFLADTIILIRDKLRTNISSAGSRVYTSYPKNPVIYPMITVIDSGTTQLSKLGMSSEGTLLTITLEIRIWTKSTKERDEMSQEIYEYLRTNQLDTTTGLKDSGLSGFSLTSMVNVDEIGESGIKSKVMEVQFLFVCS